MNRTVKELEKEETDVSDEYYVNDAEIANKQGNYVFTVGNVGSGKSTLQNLLIYRLWSKEDIVLEYANQDGDHRHDKLLDVWSTSIKRGELPERTKEKTLQEFSVHITQGRRRPLKFSFLEISGEDIKSIVPTLDKDVKPKIYKPLVDYLKTKKRRINKRFIFVSDCSENRKNEHSASESSEDHLFKHLLTYMLSNNGLNIKRLDILFVASKWDLVNGEYRSAEQYFRKNFPQTRGMLNSDKVQVSYIPFSIGDLDTENVNGKIVQKIVSLESKYIDYVIQWIYSSFTGNDLIGLPKVKISFWDRVKRILRG